MKQIKGVHLILLLKETLKNERDCFKNSSYYLHSTFNALSVPGCQENPDDPKEPMYLAPFESSQFTGNKLG